MNGYFQSKSATL